MCRRKVTRKQLISYLVANGYVEKGKENTVTGVDININSNLAPQISFKRLIESRVLSEQDVERIIERASYSEDKNEACRMAEARISQRERCRPQLYLFAEHT